MSNSNDTKKYASLSNLQTFKNNLDNIYATKTDLENIDLSAYETTASVNTKINTHNTSTSAHNDIRVLISDLSTKLNNFLDVDDTTSDQLSEVLTLIENNKGTLESLTTSKINVSDIIDNLTTNNSSKVLSAAQGVIIRDLITDLEMTISDLDMATSDWYMELSGELDDKVPTSRTVNGKALTENITITASDINTYTKSEIDDMELITVDDIDTICGGAIQVATLSNEVTF